MDLTNAVLTPIVQTLATAVFAGLLALIPRIVGLIKNVTIRDWMLREVFALEQTAGDTLSGPQKRAQILAKAKAELPWAPTDLLSICLEAAVHVLPSNLARAQSTENAIADGLRQAISESASSASSGSPVARTAPFDVMAGSGPMPPAAPGTTAP